MNDIMMGDLCTSEHCIGDDDDDEEYDDDDEENHLSQWSAHHLSQVPPKDLKEK